jgi:BirA family biotin operon repressor/biotin-[acetyl-CoA-carboxylase] ligase
MLFSISDTLFIGKQHFQFPVLHSTNEYAIELLSKSTPPEGTAISTPDQYAGRGQIGSKWESEPGKNIALSVILYPGFLAARDQFRLNIAISLAVYDFISKYVAAGVAVKWPNDIYLNDNKIAGILIQNTLQGSNIQSSVVGIGININQVQFPKDIAHPTSLQLETGQIYPLNDLIVVLCQCIEYRYLSLKSGNTAAQREEYLLVMYRYREPCLFKAVDGSVFSGCITGVSDAGKLQIEGENGITEYDLKQIKFH